MRLITRQYPTHVNLESGGLEFTRMEPQVLHQMKGVRLSAGNMNEVLKSFASERLLNEGSDLQITG